MGEMTFWILLCDTETPAAVKGVPLFLQGVGSRCDELTMMESSLSRDLLSLGCVWGFFSHVDQFVDLDRVSGADATPPACHSIHDDTGHHRLVEHFHYPATYAEWSELSQGIVCSSPCCMQHLSSSLIRCLSTNPSICCWIWELRFASIDLKEKKAYMYTVISPFIEQFCQKRPVC